jgi:four helix bundle protein
VGSKFQGLRAYELAAALGDDLQRYVMRWPSWERWTLGRQLVRAADSIGANIAEASGRATDADRRHFFVVARGSLYETEHWLARAEARGLTADGTTQLEELAKTLAGLIRRYAPP